MFWFYFPRSILMVIIVNNLAQPVRLRGISPIYGYCTVLELSFFVLALLFWGFWIESCLIMTYLKRKSLKYGLLVSLSILSFSVISHASSVVSYLRILWEDLWLTLFQSCRFERFSFLMIDIFLSNINLNFKFFTLVVLLVYLSSPWIQGTCSFDTQSIGVQFPLLLHFALHHHIMVWIDLWAILPGKHY